MPELTKLLAHDPDPANDKLAASGEASTDAGREPRRKKKKNRQKKVTKRDRVPPPENPSDSGGGAEAAAALEAERLAALSEATARILASEPEPAPVPAPVGSSPG